MAHNTKVTADANAPPITRILAEFVATHPSRGWDDGVEQRGAPHVPELGRLRDRRGAPRDGRRRAGGRAGARARAAGDDARAAASASTWRSAALLNGITSHTFDFDDTHLKTIIHPAGPGRFGGAGARRAPRRQRARQFDRRAGARHRRLVPRRQHDLSRPLRPRLAHHRLDRHARRRRGVRAAARPRRAAKTTMALGIAASQPIGVREQFGSMTKPFHVGGAARAGLMSALMARARLHVVRRARSRRRAASRRPTRPSATGTRSPTSSASASRSRSTRTSRSPAAS